MVINYYTYFCFRAAACPMFDADLAYSDENCNIICPVNTSILYLCDSEIRMTGRAICTETSTWNQTCTPVGE